MEKTCKPMFINGFLISAIKINIGNIGSKNRGIEESVGVKRGIPTAIKL